MKTARFFIIGSIAIILSSRALYYLFFLILIACGSTTSQVDTTKLNTAYFVGEYQTDYRNEIEKITLKKNGYYDYAYGRNNDTVIIDIGKWSYINYSSTHQSIEIANFPLIRKNRIYDDNNKTINLKLDVNTSVSYLGDLYDIVGEDEDNYTFVKLDKSKNNDYYLKK
jgi:hypothetical protein